MTKIAQTPDARIIWPVEHAPHLRWYLRKNVIDIAATPEAVWSQLVDCVAWPQRYKHCSDVSIIGGGSLISANSKFRFKTLGFHFEPEVATFAAEDIKEIDSALAKFKVHGGRMNEEQMRVVEQ